MFNPAWLTVISSVMVKTCGHVPLAILISELSVHHWRTHLDYYFLHNWTISTVDYWLSWCNIIVFLANYLCTSGVQSLGSYLLNNLAIFGWRLLIGPDLKWHHRSAKVSKDNDRANSSSAGLIQESGADERTIGIISNSRKIGCYKYRSVERDSSTDRVINYTIGSYTIQRHIEEFFDTGSQIRAFQHRFGTEKLQDRLSTQLLCMIRNCLPEIEEKVNIRVAEIEKELLTIPKAPESK